MPINESLEYFPLFDLETEADLPRVNVAVGSSVAVLGTPDAMGGAGALAIYMYSDEQHAWGYVGVLTGSKIAGSEQVRAMGSAVAAFGSSVVVGAEGDRQTPGRAFLIEAPYGMWSYTAVPVVKELTYTGGTKGDLFGASIAHCSDGNDDYIAVGAPAGNGQVAVFTGQQRSAAPIANPGPAVTEEDRFGASMAISCIGGALTLAVGAPGARAGQGKVFAATGADVASLRFGEALAPTFLDESQTAGFGASVALSGDLLAVGSPGDPSPDGQAEAAGSVWLYERTGDDFAPMKTRLSGEVAEAAFGRAVGFAGERLVVGMPGSGAGEALRYNRTADGFELDERLASLAAKPGARFGTAVSACTIDGGTRTLIAAAGALKTRQDAGGFLFVEGEAAPGWLDLPALISDPPVRWGGTTPDWWKKYTPEIPKYL